MQAPTIDKARSRRRGAASLAALLVLGLSGGASAAIVTPADAADTAPSASERMLRDGISLDEAIDRAQKRFRARVVRAEQSQSGGRVVYVLRLLSDEDGRVFTVRVDAQTGAMQ
jgi:uncharacterized membrane protein YkoI